MSSFNSFSPSGMPPILQNVFASTEFFTAGQQDNANTKAAQVLGATNGFGNGTSLAEILDLSFLAPVLNGQQQQQQAMVNPLESINDITQSLHQVMSFMAVLMEQFGLNSGLNTPAGGQDPSGTNAQVQPSEQAVGDTKVDETNTQNQEGSITVNSGDTLSKIAAANGISWQQLYELNKDVIGADPNMILPGQVLKLA